MAYLDGIKTVEQLDLDGKRVFVRVDFNVPLDADGKITDDFRIRQAIPTIQYIIRNGGRPIVASHLGRPKANPSPEFSLRPVAERLHELLPERDVIFAEDCVGDGIVKMSKDLAPGQILVLENLRFYEEEEGKPRAKCTTDEEKAAAKKACKESQKKFAASLADLADVYVNDAFGTCHRAHASMAVMVPHFGDNKACGYLLQKEIKYLGSIVDSPEKPFVAILGGAKVSDKIGVINNLLEKCDTLIIGGGMAYTFFAAMGNRVGTSICETDKIELAKEMMAKAHEKGVDFLLPVDNVIGRQYDENTPFMNIYSDAIPDGWMGLDIGPKTRELFAKSVAGAGTIVWNGPMGVSEWKNFAAGTEAVAEAVANSGAISIIGGGDSAEAVERLGYGPKMTHISTGGGASLEFLEGLELPGVACLMDKE